MSGLIHVDSRYEFVPPHRGTIWPKLFQALAPWYLRRKFGVMDVQVRGADVIRRLQQSGEGILLAPNHCRMSDAVVLQSLSAAAGQPFFVMASSHLFRASRLTRWALRRMGAFSIYREGIDRQAVETGVEILSRGERILETVERFHEHLTGEAPCRGPLRAIVDVGQPLPVSARRERGASGDPLLSRLADSLQTLLQQTAGECRLDQRSTAVRL